jgi:hypothetical protein
MVFFGIGISVISRPSNPLIGFERGRTTSCLVLFQITANHRYEQGQWNNVHSLRQGKGWITSQWPEIINKTLIPKERITLTVSKFHDKSHRDMAKQRVRHTQGSHDGSLHPQVLGGVWFGHPDVLIRGGLHGQAR